MPYAALHFKALATLIITFPLLRALAEADAFMVANDSLPMKKRVNAYLISQRGDPAEDPVLNDDGSQGDDAGEPSPPFQPSGSEYLKLLATLTS